MKKMQLNAKILDQSTYMLKCSVYILMSKDIHDNNQWTILIRRVRPRRLEPDTLGYLEEVQVSLLAQKEDDGDDDMKKILMWNVLEELAPRAASAASDRHACGIVEKLIEQMTPLQLRYFIHKMEGYFSHLWTNRYSSHVLQRDLSKVGSLVQDECQKVTKS